MKTFDLKPVCSMSGNKQIKYLAVKHVNAPYFNSVHVPMFTGHILGTPGSQIVDECDEAAP